MVPGCRSESDTAGFVRHPVNRGPGGLPRARADGTAESPSSESFGQLRTFPPHVGGHVRARRGRLVGVRLGRPLSVCPCPTGGPRAILLWGLFLRGGRARRPMSDSTYNVELECGSGGGRTPNRAGLTRNRLLGGRAHRADKRKGAGSTPAEHAPRTRADVSSLPAPSSLAASNVGMAVRVELFRKDDGDEGLVLGSRIGGGRSVFGGVRDGAGLFEL